MPGELVGSFEKLFGSESRFVAQRNDWDAGTVDNLPELSPASLAKRRIIVPEKVTIGARRKASIVPAAIAESMRRAQ